MAEDQASKTEKPTPKRRREARRKGQTAKSMDLNSVAVLMTGIFTLLFASAFAYRALSGMMIQAIVRAGEVTIDDFHLAGFFGEALASAALLAAPLMLAVFLAALLANLFQVGLDVSGEAITPKLDRLDPVKGFSKIFSLRALMELFKSIAKIAVIALTAFLVVRGKMEQIMALPFQTPAQIGLFTVKTSFEIFIKTCWVILIVAVIDYVYQKWQFEQQIMMSKDEMKEEHKQTEGDPHVRARIRMLQREAAKKRMMADVPRADVVLTNPTHLAVALRYDPDEAEAPLVLAKGQDFLAQKIKEIAAENEIPLVENKPLAQSLYKSVEVGEMIPVEFYQAVADILAMVYRIKGRTING